MAIETSTFLLSISDGLAVNADGVKGTYVVVDKKSWEEGDPEWVATNPNSLRYRDDDDLGRALGIPTSTLLKGSICYVGNEDKYYTWNGEEWEDGLKGIQESNLVTSISSSSTDDEYPSAKCMYNLIGDIEDILGSI